MRAITPSHVVKYGVSMAKPVSVEIVVLSVEPVSITTYENGCVAVQVECPHCTRLHSVEVPKTVDGHGNVTNKSASVFVAETHCQRLLTLSLPQWATERRSFASKRKTGVGERCNENNDGTRRPVALRQHSRRIVLNSKRIEGI